MTTINCSAKCIHQYDGKCMLDNVTFNAAFTENECIFFQARSSTQFISGKTQHLK